MYASVMTQRLILTTIRLGPRGPSYTQKDLNFLFALAIFKRLTPDYLKCHMFPRGVRRHTISNSSIFLLKTNPLTNLRYSAEEKLSELVSIFEHMEIGYFEDLH